MVSPKIPKWLKGKSPSSSPQLPIEADPPPYPRRDSHNRSPPPHRPSTSSRIANGVGEQEQDVGVRIEVNETGTEERVVVDDVTLYRMMLEDYRKGKIYIKELEWRIAVRKALKRNLYKWYALAIIVITLSILLSTHHESVVEFCKPLTSRIRSWPAGWMIPLVLLVIVSFPPLIGHEIIGLLVGLVWGIGIGFAILAAGTFIGEIAVWIAFKWLCTARAEKFEKRNKLYSSLTQLIREKSFMFVLVLRFSAVPGHITTAVSASAGASFWSYLAAAFLTLPKQLTIVYLGSAFGTHSRKDTIISVTATVATLVATVIAAVYIYYQMRLIMLRTPVVVPGLPSTMEEARRLTLDLTETTLGRRGTEAGLKSAPHDKFEDDTQAYSDLHSRRPWLSRGVTQDGVLGRAWSLPGPMSDEQVERLKKTELGGEVTSVAPFGEASNRESGGMETPMMTINNLPFVTLADDTSPSRQPISGSYSPRGALSLDLPRNQEDRLGGREIADDADLYAISRGAKRPTYGRNRGESRAALLGKPDWEDRSESGSMKGFGKPRDRPFSVETPGLTSTHQSSTDIPLIEVNGADRQREKEYGRSRGESGAALLRRPDSSDYS